MTPDRGLKVVGVARREPSTPPPCPIGEGSDTPPICGGLSDGLAVAVHSVTFVQRHAGIVLTTAGHGRLVEVVVGLVAQLEEWAADPLGAPPDPWTYLRRRWHRQERLGWWGVVPATTRRMLTGVEPLGRDSLLQIACRAAAVPGPTALWRWRTGLLDFDPASDEAAAKRLAVRRASRRGVGLRYPSPQRDRGVA